MPAAGQLLHDYPPDDEIVAGVRRLGSLQAYSAELGIRPGALDRHVGRQGLRDRLNEARRAHTAERRTPAGAGGGAMPDIPPGSRQIELDAAKRTEINELMRAHGMEPEEWVVVRARVNEWGPPDDLNHQLRVDLEPRSLDSLAPARADGWRPPTRVATVPKRETELVAFFGDQHAPHHDPQLHAAACAWLRRNRPERGVLVGDLIDLDAVAKFRHNPEWAASMQQCIDSGYSVLRGYVQASPGTRWQLLSGNHEDRLRNSIIDHLRAIYGVTRAALPDEVRGEAVLSIKHLLRLDELGIEWVDPKGEYHHGQVKVSEHLAARHGWIVRKGSGSSAIATLDALRFSCVIGHSHRQSLVSHTAHTIDGEPIELLGCEAGTMAQVKGGLGHSPAPDWQRGFAAATIWPDGSFHLDLAKWVNGTLLWRDQRYVT